VFFGRFIAFLRVTSAWLAGISRMTWWRFLLWNAAGGILWATGVSLLAYQFGKAAADAVSTYGLYAVVVIAVVGLALYLGLRYWKKRMLEDI
jgi:membrane protein DedA with SNARE-associated domain